LNLLSSWKTVRFSRNVRNCNILFLTFMEPCIFNVFLRTTNEVQLYTVFFIVVSALHVSSGISSHHQELKKCICSIGTCQTCVLLPHKFDKYRCCIYSFWAPDDERKYRSKHVEHWQQ
jgi:hypothetical protein